MIWCVQAAFDPDGIEFNSFPTMAKHIVKSSDQIRTIIKCNCEIYISNMHTSNMYNMHIN